MWRLASQQYAFRFIMTYATFRRQMVTVSTRTSFYNAKYGWIVRRNFRTTNDFPARKGMGSPVSVMVLISTLSVPSSIVQMTLCVCGYAIVSPPLPSPPPSPWGRGERAPLIKSCACCNLLCTICGLVCGGAVKKITTRTMTIMSLTTTTSTATTIFTIHTNIYKFDSLFECHIYNLFTSHQYCTKS